MNDGAALTLSKVSKSFGGLRALQGVSFEVGCSQIVGLIGPNGAGKTTVFNLISGLYPFDGAISLFGESIRGLPPHRLARKGLARTFQTPRVLRDLTVLENVLIGFHVHIRTGIWDHLFRNAKAAKESREIERRAYDLLQTVGLREKADDLAASLTFGEMRRVEIARALGSEPRMLLLDEPLAGVGTEERSKLRRIIEKIRARGITILLIEHNVAEVMDLSDGIVVLNFGEKIAEGAPPDVRQDRKVIEAYLGEERERTLGARILDLEKAPLLEIESVSVNYGEIQALQDVSLTMAKGEIVALIGANGAGKTTVLRTISGVLHPVRGQIRFFNRPISQMRPHEIANLGISHVPEGRQLFSSLSVRENLEMGAYVVRDPAVIRESIERVEALFPRLSERKGQLAGTLSGGEQQMLAIGRALMANPKLLLMDEPSMGLAPRVIEEIFGAIQELNNQGLSILLVEQNARLALEVAHRGALLETGRIVASAESAALAENPRVKQAYLGG